MDGGNCEEEIEAVCWDVYKKLLTYNSYSNNYYPITFCPTSMGGESAYDILSANKETLNH